MRLKKSKHILLLFAFVALVLLNTTCTKEKWFSKIDYQGVLLDTIGGHPAGGVWITLQACEPTSKDECDFYLVGQCVTDANGHFKIHDNAASSNRYMIIINGGKYSYEPMMGNWGLSEDELHNNYSTLYLNAR
jgi:hypothetical protein